MLSPLLAQIATAEQTLRTAQLGLSSPWLLERVGLPAASLPLLGVLHALRVSVNWRATRAAAHRAYEQELEAHYLDTALLTGRKAEEEEAKSYARRVARERSEWTLQRDLAGFLSMAWGGAFLTAPFLGVPGVLFQLEPWVVYVVPHVLLSLVLPSSDPDRVPFSLALLDTVLAPFDAVTRSGGVLGTLAALPSETPILHALILAALSGGGGGQLVGTLSMAHPTGWQLSTPPFLSAQTVVGWHDVWSALGAALLWMAATTSGSSRLEDPLGQLLSPVRYILNAQTQPWEHHLAHAAVLLYMALTFAWRAAMLHAPVAAARSNVSVKPEPKAQDQTESEKEPKATAKTD